MPEDQVATYDEVRDLLGLGRIRGWYWLTAIVKQGILVRCRSQEDFGLEGVTLESLNLEARYWQEPKARSRRKRQILRYDLIGGERPESLDTPKDL